MFEGLLGPHLLSGVEYCVVPHDGWETSEAQTLAFRLDGIVYVAKEDPDDGYRSCMDELEIGSDYQIKNNFMPVRVIGTVDARDGILTLTDAVTGQVVLQVGTNEDDDYYPSFVAVFSPENMSINQPVNVDREPLVRGRKLRLKADNEIDFKTTPAKTRIRRVRTRL